MRKILACVLLTVVSLLVLNTYYFTSLSAMLYSNWVHLNKSPFKEEFLEMDITRPEGDWYPLLNVYYDETFAKRSEKVESVTIFYGYGGFHMGTSSLFDMNSDYFNSFYGFYAIKNKENSQFGFDRDGNIEVGDIEIVMKYDYGELVSKPLGLTNEAYQYELQSYEEVECEAGYLRITVKTNSIYHAYKKFNRNYLQYGFPYIKKEEEPFFEIILFGKIRVIDYNQNYSLIFFIFGDSEKIIDGWEMELKNKEAL
jgi:hypothetical protein